MQKIKTLFVVLLFVGVLPLFLSGCGMEVVQSIGVLSDMPTVDGSLVTLKIPVKMTGDEFVTKAEAIGHSLGYQVRGVDLGGENARRVRLYKQSTDLGGAFIGRDWQYSVDLGLEENGQTIRVVTQTKGNNHMADPGTAKKLAEEFKARLATPNVATAN